MVNVCVTDAAKEDVYCDIVCPRRPAVKLKKAEAIGWCMCGEGANRLGHGVLGCLYVGVSQLLKKQMIKVTWNMGLVCRAFALSMNQASACTVAPAGPLHDQRPAASDLPDSLHNNVRLALWK